MIDPKRRKLSAPAAPSRLKVAACVGLAVFLVSAVISLAAVGAVLTDRTTAFKGRLDGAVTTWQTKMDALVQNTGVPNSVVRGMLYAHAPLANISFLPGDASARARGAEILTSVELAQSVLTYENVSGHPRLILVPGGIAVSPTTGGDVMNYDAVYGSRQLWPQFRACIDGQISRNCIAMQRGAVTLAWSLFVRQPVFTVEERYVPQFQYPRENANLSLYPPAVHYAWGFLTSITLADEMMERLQIDAWMQEMGYEYRVLGSDARQQANASFVVMRNSSGWDAKTADDPNFNTSLHARDFTSQGLELRLEVYAKHPADFSVRFGVGITIACLALAFLVTIGVFVAPRAETHDRSRSALAKNAPTTTPFAVVAVAIHGIADVWSTEPNVASEVLQQCLRSHYALCAKHAAFHATYIPDGSLLVTAKPHMAMRLARDLLDSSRGEQWSDPALAAFGGPVRQKIVLHWVTDANVTFEAAHDRWSYTGEDMSIAASSCVAAPPECVLATYSFFVQVVETLSDREAMLLPRPLVTRGGHAFHNTVLLFANPDEPTPAEAAALADFSSPRGSGSNYTGTVSAGSVSINPLGSVDGDVTAGAAQEPAAPREDSAAPVVDIGGHADNWSSLISADDGGAGPLLPQIDDVAVFDRNDTATWMPLRACPMDTTRVLHNVLAEQDMNSSVARFKTLLTMSTLFLVGYATAFSVLDDSERRILFRWLQQTFGIPERDRQGMLQRLAVRCAVIVGKRLDRGGSGSTTGPSASDNAARLYLQAQAAKSRRTHDASRKSQKKAKGNARSSRGASSDDKPHDYDV